MSAVSFWCFQLLHSNNTYLQLNVKIAKIYYELYHIKKKTDETSTRDMFYVIYSKLKQNRTKYNKNSFYKREQLKAY